jgi:ATP-dependent RNA helicase DHX36
MNKGGGEKARAAREGGRGGGRVAPARPKKGAPKVPTPAPSGALQILNVRVAVPGEPPPLPPRRAAPPRDFAAADAEEARDPSSLKGWRGLGDGGGFDGLGVVPGAASRLAKVQREGEVSPELLHMPDEKQDAVSELLRNLRPLEPVQEDASEREADAARAARASAALTAPTRVEAPAEGLRLDRDETVASSGAAASVSSRNVLLGRASADAVLDQLAAHEAHAVTLGARAAREALRREEKARAARDKADRRDGIVRRLTNAGFEKKWALEAAARCPEREGAFDFDALRAELESDETLTPVQRRNRVTNARRAATESRLAECVDWLCVFAPRDEIPESFRVLAVAEGPSASLRHAQARVEDARDAAAATARDQTRQSTCSGARSASEESDAAAEDRAALAGTAAREDPHVALLQRAMLARLGAYGFTRAESREALERTGWTEQDATYVLLRKLHPKSESERDAEDVDDAAADAASVLAERADEALALESIFEDAFVSEASLWTVQIPADDPSSWRPCWLEIHFPPGDRYPKTPPLVSVRQPNVPPAIRRSVAAQLAALACGDLRGEPAVFALAEWLREYLPAILEEHGEMDEAAAARKAAEAAEEEARREAEAAAEAANARGFLAGHTKFERTFAKIEAEREAEREEENRARERRAAYLRLLIDSEGDEATGEGNDEKNDAKAGDSVEKKKKSGEDEDGDGAAEEDFGPTDAVEKKEVGGGVSDVSATGPSSRDEAESSLDARLDRWEAEHLRRVAAARAKIRTKPFDFEIEDGAVIAPNTARTKEDERREEEARAQAAASAAAAAAEAAALATAKGRRAKARAEVYERAREDARRALVSGGDEVRAEDASASAASTSTTSTRKKKSGASWLTKHVAALGFGDDDGSDRLSGLSSTGTTETNDDSSVEPDSTTALIERALSSGASLLSSRLRLEESAAAAAEREAKTSKRLLDAETAKKNDKTWLEMQAKRRTLPAYALRSETLSLIKDCRASVVSGATGCGKTTQVPQFILEDAIHANKGAKCSVVVTQPRRLSAMAVAERVAAERGERIGATVGYSIRLESKVSKDTRLLFCTTGILLRRLQSDPDLSDVTHVVVDEVHERDLLSDFLLVILRSLATRRRDFRLVAMSATVDAELFQRYFEAEVPGTCGCIEIPGRTFPVAEYRLEDAIEATGYVVDPEGEYAAGSEANFNSKSVAGGSRRTFNPLSGGVGGTGGASSRAAKASRAAKESLERTSLMDDVTEETRASYPGYSDATLRCLQTVDEEKINLELIEALVALIADEYEDGAILIFLPGMAEIRALHERLLAELEDVENRFALVPLHSTLSSEEQRLTFSKPPPGVRKVVMATNIAETSVTIDDVVFVIDAGRVRETRYDPVTRMSSLVTAWCSRASGRQRRGRAGRVREGYCFHLYSSRKEKTLADFATPEISRVPLDALCLQIKILKLGDVRAFLRRAIEPPNEAAVAAALRSLQELDAVDHADELTPLGHHLAELPVDARLGKMMLYGAMFSCLDPVLTIAAGVGFRSPFLAPMDRRDEADQAKRRIAENAGAAATSDHLTLVAAYAGWIRAKARGRAHERAFLSSAFLSAQTLRQISEMRQQYVELLDQIGFLRSGAGLFETASVSKQTEPATMEASVSAREGEGSGLSAAAPPFVFAPPSRERRDDGSGKKQKRKQNFSRSTELRAALAAASVNASNEPLVRAVICAGLYPNVALAENAQGPGSGGASERDTKSAARMNARDRFAAAARSSIRTKRDGVVSLHPTSVVFGAETSDHKKRFLLFHEKVKTTKVYLRDATLVGAYPLLLFGGKVEVDHARAKATCDGWIKFRAAPRVAVLFKNLRRELDATLMRKIADPSLDVDAESAGLVRTIVELLESEETKKSETAPATDGTEREVNEAGGDDDGAAS